MFDAVGQLSDESDNDDDDCDENPDYNFVPLCNLIPKSTPPHSSRPVNHGQVTPTAEQFSSSPKKVIFLFKFKKRFLLKITYFIERILMEYIEPICSLESKLTFISICSIRIRSRTRDIVKITVAIPHESQTLRHTRDT